MPAAVADIDLEFRPIAATVAVDEVALFGLYAVSDDPHASQLFAAMEVIFAWEPQFVGFLGIDDTGGAPLLMSSVPFPDPTGLNEADPPADGDGLYVAWAPLGQPIMATPGGTLVTTFRFRAIEPVASTAVGMLEQWGGNPVRRTYVLDGTVPGLDVTGRLIEGVVRIIAGTCPEDLNGDGVVNVFDLLAVLAAWGQGGVPEDITGDGTVNVFDLLAVLAAWGICP